jgi:electron transport complex protein RnfG
MFMKIKDIFLKGFILFIISSIAGLLLALTNDFTRPYIEQHQAEAIQEANRAVGGQDQKLVSVNGYGGEISMRVGISSTRSVTGVKILKMQETPGLGTKAQEANFLAQFIGKTLSDRLQAKEDIDAITGATISTQAVADGVRKALEHHDKTTSNLTSSANIN